MDFVDLKRFIKKSPLKLTAMTLSIFLTCSAVLAEDADFSYFNIAQTPIKPATIQLNTNNNIQNTKPITQFLQNKTEDELPVFNPLPTASDFFSPNSDSEETVNNTVNDTIETSQAVIYSGEREETFEEKLKKELSGNITEKESKVEDSYEPLFVNIPKAIPTEFHTSTSDDINYYSSIDPDYEINLEGRTVKSLEIQGLQTIKPEFVLEQISTQIGSKFNSETLQKDLQNIYATGYFTDIMSIEPTTRYDGDVDLVFNIQENILVQDATFSNNSVIPSAELEPLVADLKDKPQNLEKINEAIERITSYYREKGYILATVRSVDDDVKGILCFNMSEGIINKIDISGNERTKDFIIARNIMTQPGTVYNEECLKKDLSKVFATQIFEEVDREITPVDNEDGRYNVTVRVKEKSTDSVSIGAGIDSALGVFGTVSLREDNFRGLNQKVSLTGMVGTGVLMSDSSIKDRINYSVELNFFEPYLLNPETSLASKLYYRELGSYTIPLAIERRIGADAVIQHKVKNKEHLQTSLLTGIEHVHFKEGNYGKIAALYSKNGLDIKERAQQLSGGMFLNLGPGVKYSTLDDEDLPRKGVIAQARYTESFGLSHFDQTSGRLSGGVTRFKPVRNKSALALTARAGVRIHGDNMPEFMAYRLGGPYSVRGYRMNGVGSGNAFMMGSAELLTPVPFFDRFKHDIFQKTRLAFFMDTGRVFDETTSSKLFDRPLSAISAGVGLRIFIPGIGPIAVDYGLPLTNVGHYGKSGGCFTFGTNGVTGYGY